MLYELSHINILNLFLLHSQNSNFLISKTIKSMVKMTF